MVISEDKELRLTVQIAHITTTLNREFGIVNKNKEIVKKKIKKMFFYIAMFHDLKS